MEFHEKLQELRKSRGLTQEELAECLYVSRTAISKWESGRGYPSIDSLKEISGYFSISIDELLSGEKLLSIAEKENKLNIQSVCELLFGIVDTCTLGMIILPLYPSQVEEQIYSVNLFAYAEVPYWIYLTHWLLFLALSIMGVIKLFFTKAKRNREQKIVTGISMGLGILMVLFLALTREAYAIMLAFILLTIKGFLLFKAAVI